MENIKKCTKCGRILPFFKFSKQKAGKHGLRAHCKDCQAEYHRSFYAKKRATFSKSKIPDTKVCRACGKVKRSSEFKKDVVSNDGLSSYCNTCEAQKSRERKYGVGYEKLMHLHEKADGRCQICGKDILLDGKANVGGCAVDHDHATGKVRGILCHDCNQFIGLVKEDVDVIRRMIGYVQRNE